MALKRPKDIDTAARTYFGLDGVHPNNKGYAFVANGFIDVINAEGGVFGRQIDPVYVGFDFTDPTTQGYYSLEIDPGNPDVCPVWQLHEVYSEDSVKQGVREGCTTASIGCIDCKQHIIEAVLQELEPIQERAREFEQDPRRVRAIINEGSEAARDVARDTLEEVRHAMGLSYG